MKIISLLALASIGAALFFGIQNSAGAQDGEPYGPEPPPNARYESMSFVEDGEGGIQVNVYCRFNGEDCAVGSIVLPPRIGISSPKVPSVILHYFY